METESKEWSDFRWGSTDLGEEANTVIALGVVESSPVPQEMLGVIAQIVSLCLFRGHVRSGGTVVQVQHEETKKVAYALCVKPDENTPPFPVALFFPPGDNSLMECYAPVLKPGGDSESEEGA